MKTRTREQVEAMKAKAAQFVDNVLDDPDRADEIADESVEEYAERKSIEIENPPRARLTERRTHMAFRRRNAEPTKDELFARIEELESENQDLTERLEQIGEILDGEEEDDDDTEGE